MALTWAGRLYINFRPLLLRNGNLPRAKFTLRHPSFALSYWQRYCTTVEQWARAKLCGVRYRAPPIFGRATITLGIGPHSSCNCNYSRINYLASMCTPSNACFLGPNRVRIQTSSRSVQPFLQGSRLRPTDRPRYSVCNNRPHLYVVPRCCLKVIPSRDHAGI